MALFKIEKGLAKDLATARPHTNEGWCYFTTDDGKFYIDILDGFNTANDSNYRIALNAQKADYAVLANEADHAKKTDLANYSAIQEGVIMYSQTASFPGAFYPSVLRPRHDEDLTYYGSSIKIFMLNAEIQGTLYNSINTIVELDCSTFTLNQIATINEEQSDNVLYKKFIRSARIDPNTLELIDTEWSEWKPYGLQQDNFDYLPLTAGEDYKLSGPLGLTQGINYGPTLPTTGFDGQIFYLEDDGAGLPSGGNAGQALIKNSDDDGDVSWKDIVALPKGGAQGQIIVKNSNTEGDASWQNFPELNYLPLSGGKITGTTASTSTTTGALTIAGGLGVAGNVYGAAVYGATWNDYAEYRGQVEEIKPGYCVTSNRNGQVSKTTKRLQYCEGIVSDTFGFAIGETDECKTPLAVSGRVLAYYNGDIEDYDIGDVVCAGPDGKIIKMTREEIREWPDRIVGTVSEFPSYETWGTGNVPTAKRLWIKIK